MVDVLICGHDCINFRGGDAGTNTFAYNPATGKCDCIASSGSNNPMPVEVVLASAGSDFVSYDTYKCFSCYA